MTDDNSSPRLQHGLSTTQLTVVMINRNGARSITEALSDCRREFERVARDCELIVVDNGSTDGSVDLVKRILGDAPFAWRLVLESTPGVNSARNAGLAASSGELVVFIDSDIRIRPGFLEAYAAAGDRHPSVDVFAGRVIVGHIDGRVPRWMDISGRYSRSSIVVRCDHGDSDTVEPLSASAGPVGPSMGFRRRIFERVGAFDTRFGLRPGSLAAGAEAEFVDRLQRLGENFVYVAGAVVEHPVRANQLTAAYFLRRLHGQGRVISRLQHLRGVRYRRVCGLTLYILPQLPKTVVQAVAALATTDIKAAFYYVCHVSILLGQLYEDFDRWRAKPRPSDVILSSASNRATRG